MSKRPARASLIVAVAGLLAAAGRAQDLGTPLTFGTRVSPILAAEGNGTPRVVFDSGASSPIAEPWDTVLVQGVLSDDTIVLQAARVPPHGEPSWTPLEKHVFAHGRFWAKGHFSRGSGSLRMRALGSDARSGEIRLINVEVYADEPHAAAAEAPPVPSVLRVPNPAAVRPLVHERAEWGAVAPTESWTPDPARWRITLHHTAGRLPANLAESLDEIRFIQDYHIHGRGWIDIGYHFLIDPFGHIFEGRPEDALGAHTLDNNDGNVGIALLGNYHPPIDDVPTQAQLTAVAELGRYLSSRYGIDPPLFRGHRDYNAKTACPGDDAYVQLADLRRAIDPPNTAGIPKTDWIGP